MDRQNFHNKLRELFKNSWTSRLEQDLPSKWEKHGNLILFPENTFQSSAFSQQPELYPLICRLMKVTKIARKTGVITPNDPYRRPQVQLLYGSDGWVSKTENSIRFQWDITRCMFSSGNITEKQRISSWDLSGQTVVDLYAGIGYFTLSYLVHAKAKTVYACEWNPDAIEALRINLRLNKVSDRCVVLEGDNALTCPEQIADHVNLGLIPSSEASWEVSCRALNKTGGVLHVHGNVDLKKMEQIIITNYTENKNQIFPEAWTAWANYVSSEIGRILENIYPEEGWTATVLDVVKIKSYGPCVDHLVVDVKCYPKVKVLRKLSI
ncbi:unnamed protein product [Allacma fusca]|uniref:SAM-dependent methyltransferase TRM5/TYW2-type domain-containing protein n=1 Tax=Allacma fusca TaxID=39272 RepID=A0A8J2KWC9_9HEXA|nr:unnamed protein product [Allacma fusca]